MPNDRIFNSKYAAEDPIYDEEIGSDEARRLAEEGIYVMDSNPENEGLRARVREILERRRMDKDKRKRNPGKDTRMKERGYNRTQLTTYTTNPFRRPPLIDLAPDSSFNPWKYFKKYQNSRVYRNQQMPREWRVERFVPISQEELDKRLEPMRNKGVEPAYEGLLSIQRNGGLFDKLLRKEYPCTVCGGQPNGGHPLLSFYEKHKQKWCPGCANTGYQISRECRSCASTGRIMEHPCYLCDGKGKKGCEHCGGSGKTSICDTGEESCGGAGRIPIGNSPEEYFNDLKSMVEAHNTAVFDHWDYCKPMACARNCQLNRNGAIDSLRVAYQQGGGSLLDKEAKKATHPVAGASEDTLSLTAPIALRDQYKPMAKAWKFSSGREGAGGINPDTGYRADSPIQAGDAIMYTNHDVLYPGLDFSQPKDPTYVQEQFMEQRQPYSWDGGMSFPMPKGRSAFDSDEAYQKHLDDHQIKYEAALQRDLEDRTFVSPFRQRPNRSDEFVSRGFRSKGQTGVVVHVPKHGRYAYAVVFGHTLDDIRDERHERLKGGGNDWDESNTRLNRGMRKDIDMASDTSIKRNLSQNDQNKRRGVLKYFDRALSAISQYTGERSPVEAATAQWEDGYRQLNNLGRYTPQVKVSLVRAPIAQFTRLTEANAPALMTVGHHYANRTGPSNTDRSGIETELFHDTVTPVGEGRVDRPESSMIYKVLSRKNHFLDEDSWHHLLLTTDNNRARSHMVRISKMIDAMRGIKAGDQGALMPAQKGADYEEANDYSSVSRAPRQQMPQPELSSERLVLKPSTTPASDNSTDPMEIGLKKIESRLGYNLDDDVDLSHAITGLTLHNHDVDKTLKHMKDMGVDVPDGAIIAGDENEEP